MRFKNQVRDLPSTRFINIRFNKGWFKSKNRARRYYMYSRIANARTFFIGPWNIVIGAKWLEGPARQLHPECFNGGYQ